MKQSTIARDVEWTGHGLHSGEAVRVGLEPAPADAGIVFVRAGDGFGPGVEIPACHRFLHSSSRATTLALNGQGHAPEARISTVEHLLATVYALEIDNLRVHVDGPELPAMDGSAGPVLEQVQSAGRTIYAAERTPIRLSRPVEIRDGDRLIRAEPAERLQLTYSIDFDHPLIGRQAVELLDFDAHAFAIELAPARTFGFVHEIETLRSAGLAQGGSLDNTLVLDEAGLVNEGGLRFRDEFVRHKLIDLLGDLALLGAPLHAHVTVEKGGHALHHRLVAAIAEVAVGLP